MTDPDEHALDDMLAELRQTSAEDQYMAALDTMARRVAHYYLALLANGAGYAANVLAIDYQRAQLGLDR